MSDYLILPGHLPLRQISLSAPHKTWFTHYLQEVHEDAERGIITSARCGAGSLIETWLYGRTQTDWLGLMQGNLEVDGHPVAYSQKFGEKLHGFDDQWIHQDVHAIYTRAWVEQLHGKQDSRWASEIEALIQPDGWIYNPAVSPTNVRYRMRSELFMQLAMGCEILKDAGRIRAPKTRLLAAATSFSVTGYVSAEYFRLRALEIMDAPEHMPSGIPIVLEHCKCGPGFADFDVSEKKDDYMGTAKRVTRDVAIFSPVVTLEALYLASHQGLAKANVESWRGEAKQHLLRNPLDIPAFRMRDYPAPFGDGATVYEVCAAASLIG